MCSQVPKNVQIIEYLTTTSAQITRERNNLTIWHERFDHLREQNLKLLIPKNLIIGSDPKLDRQLAFYVGCANGKQCKNPFQKGDPKKIWQSPLELVHTYLCRLMKTISVEGSQFFMTFTNDYTKMVWIYFRKKRSEALVVFKKFQVVVENSLERKIKSCL